MTGTEEKKKDISAAALIARVWQGLGRNYSFDMAAELGFYFLYSLFPFFIFMVAIMAYSPVASNPEKILALVREFLPDYLFTMAGPTLLDLIFTPRKLLAIGTLALALWSASSAVSSLMAALNRIHCVQERRSYWRTTGVAIMLTAGLVGVLLTAVFLLITGPLLRNWIVVQVGFPHLLGYLFLALRWGVWVTVQLVVLAMLFSFGPDIHRPFKLLSHGAFITIIGQFVFSEIFSIYIQNAGSYNLFYGAAGGIIGLMTWLYMMGLMILIGAQVNHELGEYHAASVSSEERDHTCRYRRPKKKRTTV